MKLDTKERYTCQQAIEHPCCVCVWYVCACVCVCTCMGMHVHIWSCDHTICTCIIPTGYQEVLLLISLCQQAATSKDEMEGIVCYTGTCMCTVYAQL